MNATTNNLNQSAVIQRLRDALADLHHNARLSFPTEEHPTYPYFDWVQERAEWEIEYLNDGGAGEPESYARPKGYIENYIVARYGKLFTWGRSGATLAPGSWYNDRRAICLDDVADMEYDRTTNEYTQESLANADAVARDIELFNAYVRSWCAYQPEAYAQWLAEEVIATREDHVNAQALD